MDSSFHERHDILDKFKKYGQGHVLKYLPSLSDDERQEFLSQLRLIPVESLQDYLSSALASSSATTDSSCCIQPYSGPVASTSTSSDGSKNSSMKSTWYELGMDAIRKSTVAAVVLAGGQGTRLGFEGPKGMYDFGLPSNSTLFQLIALRIRKLIQLASNNNNKNNNNCDYGNVNIPFYVMTSPMNHQDTKTFFHNQNYFGLDPDSVFFFSQGALPCLALPTDNTNSNITPTILMENPHSCAMAPDGNGGIYTAMQQRGILSDMYHRNIQHVHVFSIDNVLTLPADPTFIGYCIHQNADVGNKVVWKRDAHEKIGVMAFKDGKPSVVEYSELSTEMAELVTDEQKLVYGAGNICNHYYTLNFITDTILPNMKTLFHIAEKKIPTWDETTQQTITPTTTNNGIKLESFIFDAFQFSQSMAILEVQREDEFAPVKNAPGSTNDCPDTARFMISERAKRWLRDAGAILIDNNGNNHNGSSSISTSDCCEISPLVSYAGEGLEKYHGKEIQCPFHIL